MKRREFIRRLFAAPLPGRLAPVYGCRYSRANAGD